IPSVRRLSRDTGHSRSPCGRWVSDREHGDGVPRQLPEVAGLLLVGRGGAAAMMGLSGILGPEGFVTVRQAYGERSSHRILRIRELVGAEKNRYHLFGSHRT